MGPTLLKRSMLIERERKTFKWTEILSLNIIIVFLWELEQSKPKISFYSFNVVKSFMSRPWIKFLYLSNLDIVNANVKAKESIKICQNQRPFARFITASGILQDAQNKWKWMTHAKHFFSEITEPNCGMEKSFFLMSKKLKIYNRHYF